MTKWLATLQDLAPLTTQEYHIAIVSLRTNGKQDAAISGLRPVTLDQNTNFKANCINRGSPDRVEMRPAALLEMSFWGSPN